MGLGISRDALPRHGRAGHGAGHRLELALVVALRVIAVVRVGHRARGFFWLRRRAPRRGCTTRSRPPLVRASRRSRSASARTACPAQPRRARSIASARAAGATLFTSTSTRACSARTSGLNARTAQRQRALRQRALRDPLTNLPNRLLFEKRLSRRCKRLAAAVAEGPRRRQGRRAVHRPRRLQAGQRLVRPRGRRPRAARRSARLRRSRARGRHGRARRRRRVPADADGPGHEAVAAAIAQRASVEALNEPMTLRTTSRVNLSRLDRHRDLSGARPPRQA
jgi:hypothetical protein